MRYLEFLTGHVTSKLPYNQIKYRLFGEKVGADILKNDNALTKGIHSIMIRGHPDRCTTHLLQHIN